MKKLYVALLMTLLLPVMAAARPSESDAGANYVVGYVSDECEELSDVYFCEKNDNHYLFMVDPNRLSNYIRRFIYVELSYDSGEWCVLKVEREQSFYEGAERVIIGGETSNPPIQRVVGGDEATPNPPKVVCASNPNTYVVIISGGGKPSTNYYRYYHDCQDFYKVIRQNYSVPKENIFIAIADGNNPALDIWDYNNDRYISTPTDLDGDGEDEEILAANWAGITEVMNRAKRAVGPNDQLIIFVTDHGLISPTENVASIVCWGSGAIGGEILYTANEFNEQLNEINCDVISIVMEQCFSGGILDVIKGPGRIITTACARDESSKCSKYVSTNPETWGNEFIHHWTKAFKPLRNGTLCGDLNGNGYVSFKEAFTYAKENDVHAQAGEETPQWYFPVGLLEEWYGLYPRRVVVKPFNDESQVEFAARFVGANTIQVNLVDDYYVDESYSIQVNNILTGETVGCGMIEESSNTGLVDIKNTNVEVLVVSIIDSYGLCRGTSKIIRR